MRITLFRQFPFKKRIPQKRKQKVFKAVRVFIGQSCVRINRDVNKTCRLEKTSAHACNEVLLGFLKDTCPDTEQCVGYIT